MELLLGKGAKLDEANNVGERLQGVAAPLLVAPLLSPVHNFCMLGWVGGHSHGHNGMQPASENMQRQGTSKSNPAAIHQ
jgi:hypothetical protein